MDPPYRRAAALLLLALALLLCGCRLSPAVAGSADPMELLRAMAGASDSLLLHSAYREEAPPLDASDVASLFGDGVRLPAEWSALEDYALALSPRGEPREYGVFLCRSSKDTAPLAALCLDRIQALHAWWAEYGPADRAPAALAALSSATVRIRGRYVLYAIHPSAPTLLRTAEAEL